MERGDKPKSSRRFVKWATPPLAAVSIVASLALPSPAQTADQPVWTNAQERLLSLAPVYSSTHRFVAIGQEPGSKLDVVTWAEDVATRLEKMLGQPLCFQFRELRFVLLKDELRTHGEVSATEECGGTWLVQRLTITNYRAADMEAVMTHLCGLLLSGQVYASSNKTSNASPWSPATVKRVAPIPYWLACGVAQNVYPSLRARNNRLVLDAWQNGLTPPASHILAAVKYPSVATNAPPSSPPPDRSAEASYGVFFAWILSQPNLADLMAEMFEKLQKEGPITGDWLAVRLLAGSRTETLNDGWDRWILQQQRMIFEPGATTPEALTQLRAELLLYPGLSGIPKRDREGQVLGLDYLIAERRAEWIAPFARTKRARLQLLQFGRDPRYQAAVQAYCSFLDALIEGVRQQRLEKLLATARQIESTLTLSPGPAATE